MSILIADDHPLTLFGTANFVLSLGYKVCDMCNNGITAFNVIQSLCPDIAILDVSMPGLDGIEISEKVQKLKLKTRVVLLTMHNERGVYLRAIECGVFGYLLKNFSSEELEACLKAVSAGNHYVSNYLEKELVFKAVEQETVELSSLTFTEKKVLELISQQKSTKQISQLLFSSEKTIEGHRRNIIEKLNLPKEKNQLLIWALEHKDLFRANTTN
jgi:DNA-binding NarL/FixJ family response regulator